MSLAILNRRGGERCERALREDEGVVGGERLELVRRRGEGQPGQLGELARRSASANSRMGVEAGADRGAALGERVERRGSLAAMRDAERRPARA